jgi:hypothetical protein
MGVAGYGFAKGDLKNLYQPYDSSGNPCGKAAAADFPILYFNDPSNTLTDFNACIKACPTEDTSKLDCLANKQFET